MKHGEKIAPLAAVMTAFSTLICCLPLSISAAVGVASLGAVLAPLRPWLLGASVVLLALGFVQLQRGRATCRRGSPVSIAVLAFSAFVVLALLVFPQAVAALLANVHL